MSSLVLVARCLLALGLLGCACAERLTAQEGKNAPAKKERGVRIWLDDSGNLHLATHAGKQNHPVFSGTISLDGGQVSGVRGVDKLEGQDQWKFDYDKNVATFRIKTGSLRDAIILDFKRRPQRITFDLQEDGQPMSPSRIHIGKDEKNPEGAKFSIPGK